MDVKVEVYFAGDGVHYPAGGNTVTVHYTGYLEDGTKFDSTHDRKKPFTFRCTDFDAIRKSGKPITPQQVILGLDIAVQRLSVRERGKVFIPSSLAYGKTGFPGLYPFFICAIILPLIVVA